MGGAFSEPPDDQHKPSANPVEVMLEETNGYKSITEVERLAPEERLAYLRDQWGMADLHIRGLLKKIGDYWWLTDVTDTEGRGIAYPLSDQKERGGLRLDRVFVASENSRVAQTLHHGVYAIAAFDLAWEKEREKHGNPLLIQAIPQSIQVVQHIPPDRVHQRKDGSIDLEETLCRGYFEELCKKSSNEIDRLNQQRTELEQETANAATQLHTTRHEFEEASNALDEARGALAEVRSEHHPSATATSLATKSARRPRQTGRAPGAGSRRVAATGAVAANMSL